MQEVNCKDCKCLEPDDDDMGFDYCPYWISCGDGDLFEPKNDVFISEVKNFQQSDGYDLCDENTKEEIDKKGEK